MEIVIPADATNDDKGKQIMAMLNVVKQLLFTAKGASITIDSSQIKFLHPFVWGPLTAFIAHQRGQNADILTPLPHEDSASYWKVTRTADPLPLENISDLSIDSIQLGEKTYIPHMSFSTQKREETERNKCFDVLNGLIKRQLGKNDHVSFILAEMTDNIVQHANTDRGYVFAQYYPKKEHMDIVVADLGVTVKGGYSSVGKNFKTDREALETALQGVSRKIEEKSRGYGIYCTRRIVEEGLNGNTFYMVSGNAFSNVIRQKVADLPDELSWPGTLLLIRLPKRPLDFKLSDYYE